MNLVFLRKMYLLYPLFELFEGWRIKKCRGKKNVFIYQMGKVGSSTVYKTI